MRTSTLQLIVSLCLVVPIYSQSFPSTFLVSSLDGSNGFTIRGIAENDGAGSSVSGAGDVNGDGIEDLIIGAPGADPEGIDNAGESYVVFGRPTGFPAVLDLSILDGNNGFAIPGIAEGDLSGRSVSGAGDVNGDGIDDLIIGAPFAGPEVIQNAGESYVVFGRPTGFPAVLNLSTLDGSNGFTIRGAEFDMSGDEVSGAGDVNGDGIDDLIISAPDANVEGIIGVGESYVVFGSSTGFPEVLDLFSLDGSNGFTIQGMAENDQLGSSVSGAGDVNGDGIEDLIIGAFTADPEGIDNAGESYVVFGRLTGFPAVLDLSILDGNNGFAIPGIAEGDLSGLSVSGVGDVNGDGIDDLIIGSPFANPGGVQSAGESYVVFGRTNGFPAVLDLSTLDGNNGFAIQDIAGFNLSGREVSGAGDVNGDGINDLIIGAPAADAEGISTAGKSYVVFGRLTGFPAVLDLSTLDGFTGFTIPGTTQFGNLGGSVSSAGDINGDGIDDLVIGASNANPGGVQAAGESYVIFGRSGATSVTSASSFLDLEIAPNPTVDIVTISAPAFAHSDQIVFFLVDQLGRAYPIPVNKSVDLYTLDLRSLSQGVYFLHLTFGNQLLTRRIVKLN